MPRVARRPVTVAVTNTSTDMISTRKRLITPNAFAIFWTFALYLSYNILTFLAYFVYLSFALFRALYFAVTRNVPSTYVIE